MFWSRQLISHQHTMEPHASHTPEQFLGSLRSRASKYAENTRDVKSHTVDTGRTIRKQRGWDKWAIVREFLQNTVDHLQLLDPQTGFRRRVVDMKRSLGKKPRVTFSVMGVTLCTILVNSDDKLTIEQHFTPTLSARALETGARDIEKHASGSASAGGYGDGFKSAAQALLARHGELVWSFHGTARKVSWTFAGEPRLQEGTFQEARVMIVQVKSRKVRPNEPTNAHQLMMRQAITCPGIGTAFLEQGLRRFTAFWPTPPPVSSMVVLRAHHTLLASPKAFSRRADHEDVAPEPGLYVKGIWVKSPSIPDTVFCSMDLCVSSRDRNDVREHDEKNAVLRLFQRCAQDDLRALLQPLLAKDDDDDEEARTDNWLLQGGFVRDQLVAWRPTLFRQILDVPADALFLQDVDRGSRMTQWMVRVLQQHNKVIVVGARAHGELFPRASEHTLKDAIVEILDAGSDGNTAARRGIEKMLAFCQVHDGGGVVRVMASPLCEEFLLWQERLFIPATLTLGRIDVVKLGTVLANRPGIDMEKVNALQTQACQHPENGFDEAGIAGLLQHAQALLVTRSQESRASPPPPSSRTILDLTCEQSTDNEETESDTGTKNTTRGGGSTATTMKRPLDGGGEDDDDAKRAKLAAPSSFRPAPLPNFDLRSCMMGEPPALDDEARAHRSALAPVHDVPSELGGGTLLVAPDVDVAALVSSSSPTAAAIAKTRGMIDRCLSKLHRNIPGGVQRNMVQHAYDPTGTYKGFCQTTSAGTALIVLNVAALLHASVFSVSCTLTHEFAHLADERGHGSAWRARHMYLLDAMWQHDLTLE